MKNQIWYFSQYKAGSFNFKNRMWDIATITCYGGISTIPKHVSTDMSWNYIIQITMKNAKYESYKKTFSF